MTGDGTGKSRDDLMRIAIWGFCSELQAYLAEDGYQFGSEQLQALKPALIEMWSTSFNQGMSDIVAAFEADGVATHCDHCGEDGTVRLLPKLAGESSGADLGSPDWL